MTWNSNRNRCELNLPTTKKRNGGTSNWIRWIMPSCDTLVDERACPSLKYMRRSSQHVQTQTGFFAFSLWSFWKIWRMTFAIVTLPQIRHNLVPTLKKFKFWGSNFSCYRYRGTSRNPWRVILRHLFQLPRVPQKLAKSVAGHFEAPISAGIDMF